MKKRRAIVGAAACLAVCMAAWLAGCGRATDDRVEPIAGRWVYRMDNDQVWAYEFGGGEVSFSIDSEKKSWNVTAVTGDDATIHIDVDGVLGRGAGQNSRVTVERLADGSAAISSGLHAKMIFTRE